MKKKKEEFKSHVWAGEGIKVIYGVTRRHAGKQSVGGSEMEI